MEDLLRGTLGGRINFTTSLAPDLSAIEADVRQLEEILVHLVTNARDAMPEGGILSIDTENVELDASYAGIRPGLDPGNYVLMKVSDNGSGMDQFVLSRVFEPFFTTKARGDGTGLGLPMVFGIVAQSGGDIEIESQVDVGTTCRVLLPATDQSATLVVPDPPPRALIGSETVLVVEDEESMREATERILTRNGYKVLACASGPEAIVAAQNHRGKIDLLITDVIMPEMLGTDVAANIEQVVPSVPVLFMSGYARPVLGPRVTEDTVLLAKPFSAQALLAKVRGVIDRSRPNREGR
jgi:CheY-like chemotaxis protein